MTSGAEGSPSAGNPFAALGLPATFVPAPPTYQLGKLEAVAPGGARLNWHVIIFDTAGGRLAHAFTDAELRVLVDQLATQLTGLTLATELPAHLTNGGRT